MRAGHVGAVLFFGTLGIITGPHLAPRTPPAQWHSRARADGLKAHMLRKPEPWTPERNVFDVAPGGGPEEGQDPVEAALDELMAEPAFEVSAILSAGPDSLAVLNGRPYAAGDPILNRHGRAVGRVRAIAEDRVTLELGQREVVVKLPGPSAEMRRAGGRRGGS